MDERDHNDTQAIMSSVCERSMGNSGETMQSDDVMTLPYKVNQIQTTNYVETLAPLAVNTHTENVRYQR